MPTHGLRMSLALCLSSGLFISGCANNSVGSRSAGFADQQLVNLEGTRPAELSLAKKALAGFPSFKGKSRGNAGGESGNLAKGENPGSKIALARLCERRGQLQQARELYEADLEKSPDNPLIHHRLAIIAAREERSADALRHFETARELAPRDSGLLSDLGYAYYLQHRLDEAEECLQQAVAADSQNKAAHNNLGIVLGVRGKFDEALSHFRKGGTEAAAFANLAYVHSQLGDLDKALANYNRALSLDGDMRSAAEALIQLHDLKAKVDAQIAARDGQTTGKKVAAKVEIPGIAEVVSVPRSAERVPDAEMEVPEIELESAESAEEGPDDVPEPADNFEEAATADVLPAVAVARQAPVFSPSRRILNAQAAEAAAVDLQQSLPAMVRKPARIPAAGESPERMAGVEGIRTPMNTETSIEMPHQGSMALKHPSAQPTWSAAQAPSRLSWTAARAGEEESRGRDSAPAVSSGKMPAAQPAGS
jgi:tetratricopeptide (TPR) repeat protein